MYFCHALCIKTLILCSFRRYELMTRDRVREAQAASYRISPELVAPRPARRTIVVGGPRASSVEILRQDRMNNYQSCLKKSVSVSKSFGNREPYRDPELYSYGVLPPMVNPSKIRGPKIHLFDSEDAVSPKSLAAQEATKSPSQQKKTTSLQIKPWDSTARQIASGREGLWRPPGRHRAF